MGNAWVQGYQEIEWMKQKAAGTFMPATEV